VLRGASFTFRVHGSIRSIHTVRVLGRIFSVASAMTPFFLALAGAAIASGRIQIQGNNLQTNTGSYWFTPFTLTIGVMALALCVTISAIYLTVEATKRGDRELTEMFRLRGLIAGALTATFGALGLILSAAQNSILWRGMLDHGWPLAIVTIMIAVATAAALFFRRYQLARILIIGEAAFLLATWGVSQIPYLIPPDVKVVSAASPQTTQVTLLIGIIIALIIVIPSLWYLFYIFKIEKVPDLVQNPTE
jgi:cytochrome bd ubiquinol oxidase subunit II